MSASQVVDALGPARALAQRFEGLRLRPYLCPAGIPSIGFGATFYRDGRRVTIADAPISRDQAVDLLDWQLEVVFLPAALRCCPKATGGALAALADFALYLGAGRLAGSTLRRKFNAGDRAGAALEVLKWNRGGGRVLPGLVARRRAEAALLANSPPVSAQ